MRIPFRRLLVIIAIAGLCLAVLLPAVLRSFLPYYVRTQLIPTLATGNQAAQLAPGRFRQPSRWPPLRPAGAAA
ncbi:MAG: hypothetical protein JRJ56_06510 [Deltaproteobacteria bacterium]|nr:hypothetical protein [Deltaproteobacteria bacterium]